MMENNNLGGVELEVSNIFSELDDLIESTRERICILKNFKDSGSAKADDMMFLEAVMEGINRLSMQEPEDVLIRNILLNEDREKVKLFLRDRNLNLEYLKVSLAIVKSEIVDLHLTLDMYENRFPKLNVPTCYFEPLQQYLVGLREFMKLTWKEPAKKNREEEQRSLVDWMKEIDQSNELDKTTFDGLKTVLIAHGIQISLFLIEHFKLLKVVFSKRKEIEDTLDKVVSILKCLSVEENSFIINAFVSVVQLFSETLTTKTDTVEGKDKKEKEEESSMEINYWLENEIECVLLRLIIIEVLRLEVTFFNLDIHEVSWATAFDPKDIVLKNKLNRVSSKVNELKKELKQSMADEGSGTVLHQELETRVKEIWNKLELNPGAAK